jgi:hypothetical protein
MLLLENHGAERITRITEASSMFFKFVTHQYILTPASPVLPVQGVRQLARRLEYLVVSTSVKLSTHRLTKAKSPEPDGPGA